MTIKKYYFQWLFFLVLISELAFILVSKRGGFVFYRFENIFSPLLGLANFDGRHYIDRATRGYVGLHNEAFFPFFPFLIRTFSPSYVPKLAAGVLISLVCFYFALQLFVKLCQKQFDSKATYWSVIALLTFPTAFFFVSVYTESLFLLLALLVFKFGLEKKWLLASVSWFFCFLFSCLKLFL